MKYNIKLSIMLTTLALALMLVACDKAPKGDKAVITDQELAKEGTGETFTIDSATSQVRFTGNGVGKNHPGTFKVTYGTVTVNDDSITGGTFIMDIRSMDLEQEGEMIENKLRPHLLSGDFFDAEKFGTSKFEITKVEPYKPKDNEKSLVEGANYTVSGNLQIKNVTKNITFPARIDLDGNTLKAEANFDIDRRQWQMNYGNDKTLGDNFISETVNIELDVQARKENNTSAQAN
jgi:polyisoprenoid-binding protein YceI